MKTLTLNSFNPKSNEIFIRVLSRYFHLLQTYERCIYVCVCIQNEIFTNARMQAVTPVPHEATTGLSNVMPAACVLDQ